MKYSRDITKILRGSFILTHPIIIIKIDYKLYKATVSCVIFFTGI